MSYRSPKFAHPVYEEIYLDLVSRELDEDLACELIDDVIKEKKGTGFPNKRQVARKIAACLSHRMHFCDDLIKADPAGGQKVLVMLGPTGVGKTTTLAKLAARAVLEQRLKVGFITVDTFRIAATEQLKTYAEIIDVPTRVVENVRLLTGVLQEFADRDLVLIDTAGRSPREMEGLSELAESLNALPGIHKALLLAATTKRSDLIEIAEKYKIFDPSCVIFTKLDETYAYGSVISQLVRSTCPLAYVTVGQNVPKDILAPDAARLVSLFEASDGIALKELRESAPAAGKTSTRALRKRATQAQNTFTHKGVNHECLTRPQL